MRLSVETQNVYMKGNGKVNIKRNTKALFSQLRDLAHSVEITLADANGPKGGIGKECTVVVS